MSLQVEKLEKSMARLTIEVTPEELENAIQSVYMKNRNKINIPGFRKGKAPRKIIEQMYGKGIFYEDAANEIIPGAYEKAVDECTETIVSSPTINVVQLESGKPFVFTADVALKPEVTLGQYKGIEVEKINVEVTEEEIMAQVEQERDNSARIVTVSDRPVVDGDIIKLDFKGYVDGEPFDGGEATDYELTIGSGSFIPGFEEGLIGVGTGEEKDVEVTFPEDYQAKELAGKPAVFHCTVKEIRQKELPDLDDEFASEVSEYETMDEYKDSIREKLTKQKQSDADNEKQNKVIDAIIEDSEMEIADAQVETEERQMYDEFARNLEAQGLTMEQYLQFTGMSQSRMLEQIKPQALKRIQSRLVLEAVAKAEEFTASDEDFEEEVEKMAKSYDIDNDRVKEILGEKGRTEVEEDICVNKAVKFVVDNAVEVEKTEEADESAEALSDDAAEETE